MGSNKISKLFHGKFSEDSIEHKVNFILLNKIEHNKDRFILDGLLFNTRSGGLIHGRKIDIKRYLDGQINELVVWVGNTLGIQQKDWQENRNRFF